MVAVVANIVGDPQPVGARDRRLRLSLDRGLEGDVGARAGPPPPAGMHLRGKPAPFEPRLFVEAAWSDDVTVYLMVAHTSALALRLFAGRETTGFLARPTQGACWCCPSCLRRVLVWMGTCERPPKRGDARADTARAPGGLYRPRNPRASPLWQCAKRHANELGEAGRLRRAVEEQALEPAYSWAWQFVSVGEPLHRPVHRAYGALTHPREDAPTRGEGGGEVVRYFKASGLPHSSPCLRDSPPGRWSQHPRSPGTDGPQGRRDDHNVRAFDE